MGLFFFNCLPQPVSCLQQLLGGDPQKRDLRLVKTRARNQEWHGVTPKTPKWD